MVYDGQFFEIWKGINQSCEPFQRVDVDPRSVREKMKRFRGNHVIVGDRSDLDPLAFPWRIALTGRDHFRRGPSAVVFKSAGIPRVAG